MESELTNKHFSEKQKTLLNLDTTDAASTYQIYSKPYLIVIKPKSQMAPWYHGGVLLMNRLVVMVMVMVGGQGSAQRFPRRPTPWA